MLPTTRKDASGFHAKPDTALLCLRFLARRYLVFGVTGFVVFSLLLRTLYVRREIPVAELPVPHLEPTTPEERWPGMRLPPLYPQYLQYEHQLPQHHWNAPSHATEPNMFWIPGHSAGSGWGNIMQEILLNAFLAYKANRAFVFYNYTWNSDLSQDYSDYSGKPIPSRVPLSALIRGPIVGGAWPSGVNAPLAVSEEYWHHACDSRKVVVPRADVHDHVSTWFVDAITTGWVNKLHSLDHEQCVEAGGDGGPPYTWVTFGEKDAMPGIWPEFRTSPILTHFAHSALVELAFDTNREIFSPSSVLEPPLSAAPLALPAAQRYPALPGLLVLHIRRGDYAGHCAHLARWSSTYLAYNTLPELPDRFDPPPGGAWGENTPENVALYMQHCFPDIAQIVRRVEDVAQTDAARGLEHVYVMTNGAVSWVEELKAALGASGRWKHVASSRDLVLNWEQKYVAQAVDMLIGQRAQVFIGNGWSSLTGNAVVMRMANGFRPDSTRFW
ncbi:hypothetical protein TRAPUB_12353 [Trametes pubescens]|uniref:Uncharacterized protein n=1 Tax=Trametes pubescens TaxID=154538 RepID=A0A1M2VU52_TRAPU|nr:hypothetical protein TRAPUB_12353 [Trametes pubescens]